jgi:hypothetical protein
VLLSAPRSAGAQVALESLRPAPLTSDGFALSRPEVLERGQYQVRATLDYANDPLVVHLSRAHTQLSVVHNHMVVHVGGALALGSRVTLFGALPVHVWMEGTDPRGYIPAADGAGLGDLMLGGRVRLLGSPGAHGTLSAELLLNAPTAELASSKQTYSGDAVGSYEPALTGELRFGRVDLRLRAGARFRKETQIGDLSLGQQLVYGVGGRVRVVDGLHAQVELYGGTYLGGGLAPELSPLELLFGAKWQLADWNMGAAVGPGLVRGYGAADVRALAAFAYAPVAKQQARRGDRDGDGVPDASDRCVDQAEDLDGFEDHDGCPDLDDDRDGVPDVSDHCPASDAQGAQSRRVDPALGSGEAAAVSVGCGPNQTPGQR